ncbi:MAG: hypothetical protein OEW78_09050 [Nitrosopumilus sp.]|uniref:hypothetical protein n=1 Tax=Nitrosopumilus sp. TaxID=2024843 RepID=UPI0024725B38|nr:hypothetical protein [Nitrosopumilus sp.]MDH5432009.1 hypothetical protein [Nitrosopumilus sp.]
MSELNLANQEKFLNSILNVSGNIRYVMIYDLKGNNIIKRKMDGVTDLLTDEENKIALKHTVDSWNFRNSLSEKIGDAKYTLQVYENLLRVLFPFGKDMILVISLDNAGNPHDIIARIQTILSGHSQIDDSDHGFEDSLKQSFKYWSGIDEDSPINCYLVWKKILKGNSELLKNQTMVINNKKQNAEEPIMTFLEHWSQAIEESNYEMAKSAMQKWEKVWNTTINDNALLYAKILKILQKSWEDIQSKNIE